MQIGWLIMHCPMAIIQLQNIDFRGLPMNELKPLWHSGMTQADAIQALINAHEVTGDKKYLDSAKMLLNSFFVELKDGGVTYKTPTDGQWYEGYTGIGGKEPRTINGMIIAILRIHKYYEQYISDANANIFLIVCLL